MTPSLNHQPPTQAGPMSLLPQDSVAGPTTLLLIDDHELVRCGVKAQFEEVDGMPLRWLEASTLEAALAAYGREEGIHAVLLDLNLTDCKGLQGLRNFVREYPGAKVAVFSATHDEFVVRQARALGAVGFVPKGAGAKQMREALTALLRHHSEQRIRATPNTALFPSFPMSALYDRVAELGDKHLEILELVLSGCTNQEISNTTNLCLGTVKNYLSALMLALDVRSRLHLCSLFR